MLFRSGIVAGSVFLLLKSSAHATELRLRARCRALVGHTSCIDANCIDATQRRTKLSPTRPRRVPDHLVDGTLRAESIEDERDQLVPTDAGAAGNEPVVVGESVEC